ncbi:Probable E3 ubiquitin-protein ligase XERICO [Linum perenne]
MLFIATPINSQLPSGSIAGKRRRVSITQFRKPCCSNNGGLAECCVCLCGFEDEEEVSELSCKHFFHKGCLQKWFDNHHMTCPLCRSMA